MHTGSVARSLLERRVPVVARRALASSSCVNERGAHEPIQRPPRVKLHHLLELSEELICRPPERLKAPRLVLSRLAPVSALDKDVRLLILTYGSDL